MLITMNASRQSLSRMSDPSFLQIPMGHLLRCHAYSHRLGHCHLIPMNEKNDFQKTEDRQKQSRG